METFKGLWTSENGDGTYVTSVSNIPLDVLNPEQVLVQVFYSSLNYKDALSSSGHRGITRNFPHIPGIDAAGIVINDPSGKFKAGSQVIITGFDLGMNAHGGLCEFISVPSNWIIKLPSGLTLEKSMQIGTAGLTAGMAMLALQQNGIKPSDGPIVVSGATGGLAMCTQGQRFIAFWLKLLDNFCPQYAASSEFGYFSEVIHSDGPKETKSGCKIVYGQTCS